MINDADLCGDFRGKLHDFRRLGIGNDPDPPHPRRVVGDGAHTIIQLVTAQPPMGVGAIVMQRRPRLRQRVSFRQRQMPLPLRPMHRVRPVHPSNDCINFKHETRHKNVIAALRSVEGFWEIESMEVGGGMWWACHR